MGLAIMIKSTKFLLSGVAALALSSAAAAHEDHASPELLFSEAETEANADARPAIPTMDFGTWGVDLTQVTETLEPGNDFNAYVNGKWIANNEIPADRSRFGAFDMLREKSTRDVETLVRELVEANPEPGTTARRIVDAYNAYYNVEAIDASGLTAAYPYLTKIYAAADLTELVKLFPEPGIPGMVGPGVTVDARNPRAHAVSIGFDGMGLPDRDYYLEDSERNLEIRAKYKEYLALVLGKAGYQQPEAAAEAVYAFEAKVAKLEWARRMFRLPNLTYNEFTREELVELTGDFPMLALLEAGELADQDRYLVPQIPPSDEKIEELGLTDEQLALIGGGLPAMTKLLTETPLATLKAYMAVQFLSNNAAVLSSELDAANFAFFGKEINGREVQQERWKRAITAVEGQLGEQLGALYVERYFPPAAKAQMDELVANLSLSMAAALDSNEWMTEETITEAKKKLSTFHPMIGYPDEFETYEGLEISADDPLANRMSAAEWARNDALERLPGPVDTTQWGMFPQTVNAYYHPLFNQIVFPAAILQAPFFNAEADAAVNYGGIGAVIGHEIGHGYDDQGSQFDAEGALRNWWQPADREAFEVEAGKLKALIEQYCPADDGELCLRGDQSIGETLGDVVGLQMAHRAYKLSLNGEEAPVIDGLTGDQRFFLGFAQIWRGMEREASLRNRVLTANHPPSEFRLNNAVRHIDAWYEAFNVTPDHALYLPPEERVKIW